MAGLTRIARLIRVSPFIFFLAVSANGFAAEKIFTIGIVNAFPSHDAAVVGFKAGMMELGYVEGNNINYIYSGIIDDAAPVMDAEISRLVSLKIDLLVAMANEPAIQAKKLLEGSDIPILAVACAKMVEKRLVKDLKRPEGNLTGIQVPESQHKALEWMTFIVPSVRKILIPYNPGDDVSTDYLPELKITASKLDIALDLREIGSAKEAEKIIGTLPPEVGAIFLIPSPTLSGATDALIRSAVKHGIPLGTTVPLGNSAVMSFGSDSFEMGRRSARLADQIRKGIKPADLPVEIAEAFLNINLTTAEKIGLEIPNFILTLAKEIIRE